MIVWLASYPRSGNTFFRILLSHLFSIETYTIYNEPGLSSLKNTKGLVGTRDKELSIASMESSDRIFFVKTHSLTQNDNQPTIYLIRDGRDAIVSFAHYITDILPKQNNFILSQMRLKLFPKDINRVVRSLIMTSSNERNNWSTHVTSWTKRSNTKAVIRFEDLIMDPITQTNIALQRLGISEFLPRLENPKYPTFEDLHRDWPDFFRKGRSSGWREEMSIEHQKLFWKFHGEAMSKFGYLEN